MSADTSPRARRRDFALAPALRLRLLGAGVLVAGVLVGVGGILVALGLPDLLLSVAVVLATLVVLGLALLLGGRRWVVRLDEHGYRVRGLRTAQARSARWTDVLDLNTAQVAGQRCVVLRLRDGRTTTVPVDAVEGDPAAFVTALRDGLDGGHGYRRLRQPPPPDFQPPAGHG